MWVSHVIIIVGETISWSDTFSMRIVHVFCYLIFSVKVVKFIVWSTGMAERNSLSQDEALSKVVKEIVRCTNFAALKHKDQRRKDKQQTPYVNHVIGETHVWRAEFACRKWKWINSVLCFFPIKNRCLSYFLSFISQYRWENIVSINGK